MQPCCCPHPHPTSALCLSQLDQGITVGSLQELAVELEQLVDNTVRPHPQGRGVSPGWGLWGEEPLMPQSKRGLPVGFLHYLMGTAESLSCRAQMRRWT